MDFRLSTVVDVGDGGDGKGGTSDAPVVANGRDGSGEDGAKV
jgi:hypothetical protein